MTLVKKFYAVFNKTTGDVHRFDNWQECREFVSGRSDVLYRAFTQKDLAEEYILKLQHRFSQEQICNQHGHSYVSVYIDGSYNPQYPYAGWAYVAVDQHNNKVAELAGVCQQKAESRNIDGEVYAALQAAKWAAKWDSRQDTKVKLFYDYQGIESWALGDWKAKTPIAHFYIREITPYLHLLSFHKVKSHSGDKWNDYVDQLAKDAILNKAPLHKYEN